METFNYSWKEKNEFSKYPGPGLTTQAALCKLHDEINNYLEKHECSSRDVSKRKLLMEVFHHRSYLSLFRWTSVTFLFLCCCVQLFIYYFLETERYSLAPAHAFIMVIVIIVNTFVMFWETKMRQCELPSLIRRVLSDLKACISSVSWEERNYPHLHSPLSPCITLQWTKRDNAVVNLPWSLLVEGDIIFLRPGQKVPGKCQSLEDKMKGDDGGILQFGDTYSPFVEGVGEGFTSPKSRKPLQEMPFILLETPYLINLHLLLNEAMNRPLTVFNKQAHFLFVRGLEFICLPSIFVIAIVINAIRVYYDVWNGHWSESLLMIPTLLIIPIIPFAVPLAWIVLNWIGTAFILALSNQAQDRQQKDPTQDPFDGGELQTLQISEGSLNWRNVKREFVKIICGKQEVPIRSTNLIHVLASVTNLCCVDKKGILSWPNPTAEKLFFLRNRAQDTSRLNLFSSAKSLNSDVGHGGNNTAKNERNSTKESECVLMSLTHDHLTAFGLQFDDLSWKRYLHSLKPLGLNILLNTCNPATQNHYTKFCSHITCEAMYNEDLVPVSQRSLQETTLPTEVPVFTRGCLCELPKQMGFRSKAQEPFHMEHQLSTFRHVPTDMACKDRLARSLRITKLKFPFPHMVSVLMRDECSGKLELMSQGTADIILDSCTDYWDGYDIRPLTEKDRKKILDFYHRTSLSAYCTAFSYRPTTCTIKENVTDFYMELPMDPTHLYHAARTPTPHISTEALFGDNEHTEYEEVGDVEDCFRMQCKQIFIGMVTMQYQAKSDMVRMIEELESSCIRFVHFSKENELRSRVFSEKMGLESGWNCHISLLADKTRRESVCSSRMGNTSAKTSGLTLYRQSTEDMSSPDVNRARVRSALEVSRALSHSAPSAINLDVAQVKFEEEVSICSQSTFSEGFSEDGEEQRLMECSWDCQVEGGEGTDGNEDFGEEIPLFGPIANGTSAAITTNTDCPLEASIPYSSSDTSSSDQSASLNLFDMSNRARLPKGVHNIKPHLENVDNVPLLVSLFTDCTTPTTKTMLTIMQEYTEVIIVLGSTANAENMVLFMQADLGIGVDPSHPQVCMREPVFVRPQPDRGPSPMALARKLNSLPCSLTFQRDDRISLAQLILKSRNFMQHFISCFQFWACCSLSISFVELVSITAFLPPVLSSGDVMWLVCVPMPMLSVSLVFAPSNPAVMSQATGKNSVVVNKETVQYLLYYYISKFGPSCIVIVLSTMWMFSSFCNSMSAGDCEYVYPRNSSSGCWGGWGDENSFALSITQKSVACQLVLYMSITSISFVHRMYNLWHKNPFKNKVWAATTFAVLLLQILYTVASLSTTKGGSTSQESLEAPLGPILLGVLWPLILIPLNELIKRREIRVNVRYQKRARLEFGTKLGMNSPF